MIDPQGAVDSAANIVMQIMSQVGGKLEITDSTDGIHSISPSHLDSAREGGNVVASYSTEGCWFTHTRLYRVAKALPGGVSTGRAMKGAERGTKNEQRKEQAKEVKESILVGAQLPFRISFDVIEYRLAHLEAQFNDAVSKLNADAGLAAGVYQAKIAAIQAELSTYPKNDPAREPLRLRINEVRREMNRAQEQVEARIARVNARAAENGANETHYAITNFRILMTGGEDIGVKPYASSGISVQGLLRATPSPGQGIHISLNWNETGIPFYHNSWAGEMKLELNSQGAPEILSDGRGNKFHDRFMATMSGLAPIVASNMRGRGAIDEDDLGETYASSETWAASAARKENKEKEDRTAISAERMRKLYGSEVLVAALKKAEEAKEKVKGGGGVMERGRTVNNESKKPPAGIWKIFGKFGGSKKASAKSAAEARRKEKK
ncbi:hypothetical protein AB0D66_33560 [Streptomyces sp. NPDC048270]|uniref:hypothetical protein n=1 Tax=Streptomyces sp. NPDC048270 TaxID=3154615 RepID=UPI0033E9841E